MIKKFLQIMKKGVNDAPPRMVSSGLGGPSTMLGLVTTTLFIEGNYSDDSIKLGYSADFKDTDMFRWVFENDAAILNSPVIGIDSAGTRLVFLTDGQPPSFKLSIPIDPKIAAVVAGMTRTARLEDTCASWKDGVVTLDEGCLLAYNQPKNQLTIPYGEWMLILDLDDIKDFLAAAVPAGTDIRFRVDGPNEVFIFKLTPTIKVIVKSQKRRKLMSETAAPATPAVVVTASPNIPETPAVPSVVPPPAKPEAAAEPSVPAGNSIQAPAPGGVPPPPPPTGEHDLKPSEVTIDDILAAVTAIEDANAQQRIAIAAAVKTVKAGIKVLAKKGPSDKLQAKYAELDAKYTELRKKIEGLMSLK